MKLLKILLEGVTTEDYNTIDRSNIYKILDDYKVEDNHLNSYSGQSNYEAVLYDKRDIPLAIVNYVNYNNEITISMIDSIVKGKGYGKILMIYLAKKYGYENLKRTSLTSSGVAMRKELDSLFNFDYEKHINSLNKLIDTSQIDKVVNDYIRGFLKELITNGKSAWSKYDKIDIQAKPYDPDDIADIATYVKDSKLSVGYSTEDPPEYIIDLLKKLQK
jgi:hypothetical protein